MQSAPRAIAPDDVERCKAITSDLAYLQTALANLYFFGEPGAGDRGWTLIDAGIPGFTERIRNAAARRFGDAVRPSAIVLTHGHFDHVGALHELAEEWDVPIYAHELEMPYLTGTSPYPPGDASVGGGLLAASAWLYPRGPLDLRPRVQSLPSDGSVPGMPGWRWIHTPGHTPGQIALFRDEDRVLISGDAVITVKQESVLAVLEQRPKLHGPPAYFTPDWEAAERSVRTLAELEPDLIASGHGYPLQGPGVAESIRELADDFASSSVPSGGRYVGSPAITSAEGLVWAPPSRIARVARPLLMLAAAVILVTWLTRRVRS